ncbi:MAG: ABC transporter substrate-binding protein [Chloroflexi bacterium]|nr:ABC transporter substrate-binding protein [Chloroflexota bacterium]
MTRRNLLRVASGGLLGVAGGAVLAACGETETVTQEVIKEVPVETVVTREVIKEVPVQTVVTQEVIKEVPVQTVVRQEVIKEVPVERLVEAPMLPPLIVGQLNAFTGSLSFFGPVHRNAAALAADHVNRAGGVGGGSLIIISRDTGVNPVQGVESARALVEIENAVAIVGALASGVTIPVATSVTVPNQRVQISGASTAPSITVLDDNDFLFRTAPSDAAQGVVLGRLAWEQGFRNVGVMYINNPYGEGLAERFDATYTALGGTIVDAVPHEDEQPTFASELERATSGGVDALVAISYPGQAQIYVRESLEGGYADKFLFVDGTKSAEMNEAIGWDRLEGTLGTAPGSVDSPQLAAFASAYTDTYAVELPVEPYLAETYDAVAVIALAAAKAGTTTDSVAIRDSLRSIANPPGEVVGPGVAGIRRALSLIADGAEINYEGASGAVDFDENGDVFGPIEIWEITGGNIRSTGRFETP